MTVVIERGVEIPPARTNGKHIYLNSMTPGDSVVVGELDLKELANLRQAIQYRKVRYGLQFAIRRVPEGLRVWRVA